MTESEDTGMTGVIKCASELHLGLYVRHFTTLHGFNAITEGKDIVLGFLRRKNFPTPEDGWKAVIGALRQKLELKDNEFPEFRFITGSYGGDCLQMPIELRDKAGVAIDAIREMGFNFELQTRLRAFYPAATWKGTPFSKENSELLTVAELKTCDDRTKRAFLKLRAALWHDERLWCTQEGKDLAKEICRMFPDNVKMPPEPITLADNALQPTSYDFPPVAARTCESTPTTPTTSTTK